LATDPVIGQVMAIAQQVRQLLVDEQSAQRADLQKAIQETTQAMSLSQRTDRLLTLVSELRQAVQNAVPPPNPSELDARLEELQSMLTQQERDLLCQLVSALCQSVTNLARAQDTMLHREAVSAALLQTRHCRTLLTQASGQSPSAAGPAAAAKGKRS